MHNTWELYEHVKGFIYYIFWHMVLCDSSLNSSCWQSNCENGKTLPLDIDPETNVSWKGWCFVEVGQSVKASMPSKNWLCWRVNWDFEEQMAVNFYPYQHQTHSEQSVTKWFSKPKCFCIASWFRNELFLWISIWGTKCTVE